VLGEIGFTHQALAGITLNMAMNDMASTVGRGGFLKESRAVMARIQQAVSPICRGNSLLATAIVVEFLTAASFAAPVEADGQPAAMRSVDFWQGKEVVQVFGHVLRKEDTANIAKKFYWTLDTSARGKVVEVVELDKGGVVRVEFPDETGWQQVAVPPPATKIEYNFDYDNYGRLESARAKVVTVEGIGLAEREWGKVIDEAGGRRLVEFPVECVGLPRPRPGQRVVRGADWRAGHADGGQAPVGPASPGDSECWGEVLAEPDEDRYVSVRWSKTGREGSYRFDKRRFYDLEVLP